MSNFFLFVLLHVAYICFRRVSLFFLILYRLCLKHLRTIDNIRLEEGDEIKDLGVTYDSLLLFDKHISQKINKAYTMLGLIKEILFTYQKVVL